MAHAETIEKLAEAVHRLNFDEETTGQLFRDLGKASLRDELEPILTSIRKRAEFALQHSPDIYESHIQQLTSSFTTIVDQCKAQAAHTDSEFVTHKEDFLQRLQDTLEEVLRYQPDVVAAAVLSRELLKTSPDIQGQLNEALEILERRSNEVTEEAEKRYEAMIEKARKDSDQIESKARATATGVSVKDAQDQFSNAEKPLKRQIQIWGVLSGVAILSLVVLFIWFFNWELGTTKTEEIVYLSALRIVAMGSVASFAWYCLGILKGQYHQHLYNAHRRRLVNCIGAFVESAATPKQRDLVYSQLVEAVINFGDSGLIRRPDTASASPNTKVIVENLEKLVKPNDGV